MSRRVGVLVVAATIILGGCGGDDGDPAGNAVAPSTSTTAAEPDAAPADVVIDTFIFGPDPVEVAAGSTITFRNDDDILHTVTQGVRGEPVNEGFDLQLDGEGTTGEVTVAGAGTVAYFCSIHAGMDAEIVVT